MSERFVHLGDCVDLLTGCPFKSAGYTEGDENPKLLRGDNIAQGSVRWANVKRWPAAKAGEVRQYELVPGDVVLAMDRPWIEAGLKFARISDADLPALLVQRVSRMRALPGLHPRFLHYVIASKQFTDYVQAVQTGTAVPHISAQQIKGYEFRLPSGDEQASIATILGALDDKIELNRRMNETLEAMARVIFKDWFADFGPTRAKAEGRAPYLAPELWDLFPDALDDEDKPVGWQDDVLGSFANLQNGYAFKSKDWRDSGVPVVKIGSVKPAFVDLDQVSFVDEALALEKTNFRLSTGDMLVGLTGYVGETGRIPPTLYTPLLNQRVGRFLPNPGLEPFVFSSVRRPEFKEFAESKSYGSAQANVSTKDLLTYPLPNPGELIIKSFCDIASPLFKNSLANSGQTSILAQTRDLLLPKLMAGEIRLADAEKAVEAAA